MSRPPDLREFLSRWPYEPDDNVRLELGQDGREIMLVRQPMGIEEYEVDGRPDGERPHGMESALEFQLSRLAAAKMARAEEAFKLNARDCAELFNEGTIYYYRFVNFLRLKDWARAERDTARNLRLIEFVKCYAEHEGDRVQLEHWRDDIIRLHDVARAIVLLGRRHYDEALAIIRENVGEIDGLAGEPEDGRPDPEKMVAAVLKNVEEFMANPPSLRMREDSVFVRQGDYWTIQYQGQVARLKGTRGLHCLACLLHHPGREFHVSELMAALIDVPAAATVALAGSGHRGEGSGLANVQLQTGGSILDFRAKAEYKLRLGELRRDLEEAERCNDPARAAKAQHEMNTIANQLALAVGLGGRDRRAASQAERARSAVTKRIKDSVNKIAEVMPALGRHLAARIKTGYFCS